MVETCPRGHAMTAANTALWKDSRGTPRRCCRQCNRERAEQRRDDVGPTSGITFDPRRGIVRDGDAKAQLTATHARVFLTLAKRGTELVLTKTIRAEAWSGMLRDPGLIKVTISKLRASLFRARLGLGIVGIRGFGYRLSKPVTILRSKEVALDGNAAELLRDLIERCAATPDVSALAEQVRIAAGF